MVFIDGTNLFHRLDALKLVPTTFWGLTKHVAGGRDIVRIYLYTSKPPYDKAVAKYGEGPFDKIRVILGDAVATGDGNFKEKGVDALLVADLIYHAASKNCDFAILVSVDQDFAQALKRVEDFGCRTAVVSIAATTPDLLRQASDEVHEIDETALVKNNWARRRPSV